MNFAPPLSQEEIAQRLQVLDRCAGRQSSEFVPPPERPWNFGGTPEGYEPVDHAELRQSAGSPFGDCEASPLGNYTYLHSHFAGPTAYAIREMGADGLKITRDAHRWLARAHGRRELWAQGLQKRRPSTCGVVPSHGRKSLEIYSCPDGPRGSVRGVSCCGQPLLCPVCSPRISAERAGECETAFERAAARGWRATLMVFTAPHHVWSPLIDEVDYWRDCWERFMAWGRDSQELKDQREGHFGGPELTWTAENGWHFHRNLVVLHDGDLDIEAHKRHWMACLGKRYTPACERYAFDFKAMDSAEMARYCAKQGAEIAWAEGKSSSITPLTLLVQAALNGAACPLWVEAVNVVAVRKLSIVRFSRGLRDDLGMPKQKTDEKVSQDQSRPSDVLLGNILPSQWRRIVARRLEYRLLQEAQLGQEALETFMHSNQLGDLLSAEQIAGAFPVLAPIQKAKERYGRSSNQIDAAIADSPV